MINSELKAKLIELLDKNYQDSPVVLVNYSYDASPLDATLPSCVLFPKDTSDVSSILKLCNEYKQPVIVRGSGSNLAGATIPSQHEIIIDMKHFNKILEVDTQNLCMTVQPGVVTFDIAQMAEKHNLMYPPDPGSIKISTIGGNIAENSGGLRGLKYGVTSNYVLGLEVVLANGDIIETGGKLAKDVAGYNLGSLIIGSEGQLGIITKAILKLIVKPEYKKTATCYFHSLGDAGDVVSEIINARIIPVTLEIIDNMTLNVIENYANIGLDTTASAFLLIEQDGYQKQVEADMDKIIAICEGHNGVVSVAKDEDAALEIAAARRNALGALASLAPTTLLEDATVPRSRVGDFLREVELIAKKHDVDIYTFGHAGDGNMHPTAPCDIRDHEHYMRVEAAFEDIFKVAVEMGGTITGEHGVGKIKAPYLEMKVQRSGLDAMWAIKQALDPNNILNPNIMYVKGDYNVVKKS
jgi:glycolate oxidase